MPRAGPRSIPTGRELALIYRTCGTESAHRIGTDIHPAEERASPDKPATHGTPEYATVHSIGPFSDNGDREDSRAALTERPEPGARVSRRLGRRVMR